MVKSKKGQRFTARALPIAERKKLLLKTGKLIKAAREQRTTMEKFVYEINISKTQMIKHQAGGNMLLSTFLKLLHGLDIKKEEFFRELEKKSK